MPWGYEALRNHQCSLSLDIIVFASRTEIYKGYEIIISVLLRRSRCFCAQVIVPNCCDSVHSIRSPRSQGTMSRRLWTAASLPTLAASLGSGQPPKDKHRLVGWTPEGLKLCLISSGQCLGAARCRWTTFRVPYRVTYQKHM